MENKLSLFKKPSSFIYGGIIFTTIIVLWPIFMVLAEMGGDVQEQLALIAHNSTVYRWNFMFATLIAPATAFIMLLLAYGVQAKKHKPALISVGEFALALYVLSVSISYVSQYSTLFNHIANGNLERSENWFFLNPDSYAYLFNQLGYTFFAISAFLIGYKLIFEKGLIRLIGLLLWLSGALSIIAFIGYIARNELINTATVASGILMLPIGILVILLGIKMKRNK
ncbi:MAG: DUF4386 family protein [Bacillus sp. (in: Bacteria)]|nr:DUF4386 family protein [Bacillus sp. (in: firmicutes)]